MNQTVLAGLRIVLGDVNIMPGFPRNLQETDGPFLNPKDGVIHQRVIAGDLQAELHHRGAPRGNQRGLDASFSWQFEQMAVALGSAGFDAPGSAACTA